MRVLCDRQGASRTHTVAGEVQAPFRPPQPAPRNQFSSALLPDYPGLLHAHEKELLFSSLLPYTLDTLGSQCWKFAG